jgi:hypothetical protein
MTTQPTFHTIKANHLQCCVCDDRNDDIEIMQISCCGGLMHIKCIDDYVCNNTKCPNCEILFDSAISDNESDNDEHWNWEDDEFNVIPEPNIQNMIMNYFNIICGCSDMYQFII